MSASSVLKLPETEVETLEGKITLEEAGIALKNMKNGKSPGTDGMTVEFFKFFWRQLGGFIVRSLNEGFEKKEMSITQREGIIICLPKGDKPREYLKNWRPISLLNVSYKIGSTCIANRIKTVLPQLISEDQTGFIQGRNIGDNLRLLYDIIYYLKEKKLPGLLVSVDFEKAFDSINWSYMHRVLKLFGFGENICQWISAFYTNTRSSVMVNGKSSSWFSIERGCRQGDPISPYLFILCAELLACKIRENQNIKGITVSGIECKISQFADDTSLLLEGDKTSYETLFNTLSEFELISGLKLNYEKTCNVWLGNKANCDITYLPHLKMSWNPSKFKILGLWFTNDLSKMAELNITDKFIETKKLFNTWAKRSITPVGRVAVLKSLILSKLVYLWLMLPNPPDNMVNQLQKMCYEFIWDKKRDKVKRTIAVHSLENGGVNIPHILTYIKSLKLIWLKKCCTSTYTSKWKDILQRECSGLGLLKDYGPVVLKLNNGVINYFWRDVFSAYCEMYDKVLINEGPEILAEPLFFNKRFTIDGKVVYFEDWIDKNVFFVKDLVKTDGKFLNFEEFQRKFQFDVPVLDFFGCVSTVKGFLRKQGVTLQNNDALDCNKAFSILEKVSKGAKIFYTVLLGEPSLSNASKNWEKIIGRDIVWPKVFSVTKKISEAKLKWFQMKINYRILVTNSILMKMGILSNNLCNFCESNRDTVYHYLWACEDVQQFWTEFVNCLKEKCSHCDRLNLNASLVLFGHDNKTHVDEGFSHILLAAKFFIYKCRMGHIKPQMRIFLKDLSLIYKVDKQAMYIRMRQDNFIHKWTPYNGLFQE